jgi:hypothetical protein
LGGGGGGGGGGRRLRARPRPRAAPGRFGRCEINCGSCIIASDWLAVATESCGFSCTQCSGAPGTAWLGRASALSGRADFCRRGSRTRRRRRPRLRTTRGAPLRRGRGRGPAAPPPRTALQGRLCRAAAGARLRWRSAGPDRQPPAVSGAWDRASGRPGEGKRHTPAAERASASGPVRQSGRAGGRKFTGPIGLSEFVVQNVFDDLN